MDYRSFTSPLFSPNLKSVYYTVWDLLESFLCKLTQGIAVALKTVTVARRDLMNVTVHTELSNDTDEEINVHRSHHCIPQRITVYDTVRHEYDLITIC